MRTESFVPTLCMLLRTFPILNPKSSLSCTAGNAVITESSAAATARGGPDARAAVLEALEAAGQGDSVELDEFLTLISAAQVHSTSLLGRLARVFQRAEPASHTLIWARGARVRRFGRSLSSDAQTSRRVFVIERVELPRLRQSFFLRVLTCGRTVLLSSEQSGYILSDERPSHVSRLMTGLPMSLVLEHIDNQGSLMLVTPSVGLRRPLILQQPFSTEVIPVYRGSWCRAMDSRVLVYPMHMSGAFLVYRSCTAALYHFVCLLITRAYPDAAAALSCATFDAAPTKEQLWLVRQVSEYEFELLLHPNS
jgi:hypothetical protein